MTQRITVYPDPLQEGQTGTVCYEFEGIEGDSVTLDVTWSGEGEPDQIVLEKDFPACTDITPPEGATTVLIVDVTNNSEDYHGMVGGGV